VYFIINTVLGETIDGFDVQSVWHVLDVLMLVGLVLALVFNYTRKREEDGSASSGAVTRQYLEVNLAFYLTAAITILFLHNWLALLALGGDSLDGNHQAWIIWAFVDVMLPLTVGTTGCRLWCGESSS
jgi:predicted histidine transporter YuiF (NhaC family)